MQSKVILTNNNQNWNAKRRYKINEVVSYSGSTWQNSTGSNSEPGVGPDWFLVSGSTESTGANVFNYEQLTESESWVINHNLNTFNTIITVYNYDNEVIIPEDITGTSINTTTVAFSSAIKGYAILTGKTFNHTPPSPIDLDAQAFITAVGTLDITNQNAIKQLVLNIKTYGLWDKIIAMWPKAGITASEHKWNLKDPRDLDAAYRQVFSGTWVHSSLGTQSNSTNTFSDTKLNMSTLGMTGNFSMGIYITVDPTNFGDFYFMGAYSGVSNFVALQKPTLTTIGPHAYGTNTAVTVPTNKGFIGMSVIGTDRATFHMNNVQEFTSVNGSGVANSNVYEGALNSSGRYGSLAFTGGTSFIGFGLTNTEMKNLRDCILVFETALGRN
ncbi:hypothetical protein [Flavobacterium phage FL-1]|nr:hypothetical protein [Flavobacterium phage FL-1]